MEKNLYIDASHPNETRIVLKSNHSIEEYEFEDKNNLNFKNNIYLATISRVEPSLQAAFVNFGRERHGFLAFNDIQSDYYQLPSEDKEKIRIAEEKIREDLKDKTIENNQDNLHSENQLENNTTHWFWVDRGRSSLFDPLECCQERSVRKSFNFDSPSQESGWWIHEELVQRDIQD